MIYFFIFFIIAVCLISLQKFPSVIEGNVIVAAQFFRYMTRLKLRLNGKSLRTWAGLLVLTVCEGATIHLALADPIGYIDGVRKKNEYWAINGWACEPASARALQLKLFLNDAQIGAAQFSSEPAEGAIHQLCGTVASSGIPYRFTINYNGPITGQNIRIDATSVDANGVPHTASINGSNEFGLPMIDPESVIASANRILVLTAHEDDEIWFSPVIGKYCMNKSCRVVTATSGREPSLHPDPTEFEHAMEFLHATYDRGTFYTLAGDGSTGSPQTALDNWNAQAREWGLVDVNNVVKLEIDKFVPDVILTFDPRHGTSCHPQHRAVGQAVIDGVAAYRGANFNKSNLFLLESRRIDMPEFSASVPAAPKDRFSVVYEMMNYMPSRSMTGFEFFINMMGKYPTQFDSNAIQHVLKADKSDSVVSLMPIANYIANDNRYTDNPSDSRITICPPFASTPPSSTVPVCSSVTLSPSDVPAGGGLVSAQANCTGNGLTYIWRVNGEVYPGNLSTNSSTVGANTTTLPITYTVCVTASSNLGLGQSKPFCTSLIQAGATAVPPSAPIIGSAVVVGDGAARVSFTPGALGSGTFINYTAACSGTFASGTSSPIVVTGLLKGSAYFCHVKVTTSAGTSGWSEWSNPVFP